MSTTYNLLVNRIKITSENDEADFNAEIQHFISRAESRLIREIDSYGVVQYSTSNLTSGDPFITKPNNTLIPRYYANFGFDRLLVAPTPVSAFNCEMSYIVQPTAATSVHQENFFTEYCSNGLFYASMKEACMFMKNYTGSQAWEQEYQRAFTDLLNESRRTRQDDMRNNASPAGGDNTLVKGSN